MLHVDEVPDLADGGHGLAATCAAYHEYVILQRHNSLPLLSIERIC